MYHNPKRNKNKDSYDSIVKIFTIMEQTPVLDFIEERL